MIKENRQNQKKDRFENFPAVASSLFSALNFLNTYTVERHVHVHL